MKYEFHKTLNNLETFETKLVFDCFYDIGRFSFILFKTLAILDMAKNV